MKQKKFVNKVQNWHKPLRPWELGTRYLRLRHNDPEYTDKGQIRLEEKDIDDYWNPYDPLSPSPDCAYGCCYGYPCTCEYTIADEGDFQKNKLNNWWTGISEPTDIAEALRSQLGLSTDDEEINSTELISSDFNKEVEIRLSEHLTQGIEELNGEIREAIGERINIDIVLEEFGNDYLNETSKLVCFFAPFWIRKPSSWKSESNRSLLEHLFVAYEVPDFLYAEWQSAYNRSMFNKWVYWFIILGQGGSLHRAASLFGWSVSKRLFQYLVKAPTNISPTQACMFAEIMRLGGDEMVFNRMCNNRSYVIDPTEPVNDNEHCKFWQETVIWLSNHNNAISDEESDQILSWGMHMYTESRRTPQTFSWKGRSLRATLDRSIQYHQEIAKPWKAYSWSGHGWDWEYGEKESETWTFEELTSGYELYEEGQALKHCVGSYAGRCVLDHSAIVSMKRNGERVLTLEINPSTGQLVQARGLQNRPATIDERNIFTNWINRKVMTTTKDHFL